ncbi:MULTISPECIES: DUF2089 family protein [Cellulophaga]|uniref:Uncharacterized protein n=1 Tax=Cellulophaga baltica TaxID=76594 RepID=A0A1G7JC63_9FLAO|nr:MULTISPECIES: DUF2089 family protein [Cellulophaga]AIY13404.1 hypothetical protein M667_09365 [Cellulophaga baltica NN016038]MBA6316199.1 DUF2089 domain-containing protein [Cellulophaga baltica]QXP51888.1 DUF2089 family protein [Cellulophaga sp. HaHa_2_1]QXP55787.1 DUF2089 family protein [Cellulophaga sp. HaHa_2_95]SDF22532.1 hypothetical protein SAMN04487992_10914 [Cellulophaga baltica]
MKKLPVFCPSCESNLLVSELSCSSCDTVISGKFDLPQILQLSAEDQEFVLQFVLNSGSLKKMAIQMNISYPTMRNKLDDIITSLQANSNS